MTKWHRSYIQNAYRELEHGITRKQLDALGINANGKRVLDVGCGPGNLLVAISADIPELLVGVDVDAIFLRVGRTEIEKLIEKSAMTPALLRAALPTLPFADASFDLVTCFLVMPHVPDDRVALTELARGLETGWDTRYLWTRLRISASLSQTLQAETLADVSRQSDL